MVLSETIRTALPALGIIAVGIWTQFSRVPDPQPAPDPAVSDTFETFNALAPAVAVEPGDPPDNDAAPTVPDFSPASPDADNV
ncbi:MAG: hypothetical protein JO015_18415 [Verrucomicrobia bacterium]|nr:hypothetical protein [Verrucomicrobiota bacterium]